MIKTKEISVVRGQTLPILFVCKDSRGQRKDLTGARVYMWIRADMKTDPVVKLASQLTAEHRIGIAIDDQTGEHKGEFTATLIPDDTLNLVALGADDPYLYDTWVVDGAGAQYPVVATSKMPLYPQVTLTPP